MKNTKGWILVVVTVAITIIAWLTATPYWNITTLNKVRHVIGGVSLNSLFIVFLLSTRNKKIEKWFGGLGGEYTFHKFLAIFSVATIIVHSQMSELISDEVIRYSVDLSQTNMLISQKIRPNVLSGNLAMAAFAILILITLFAKKMKYENWKATHRLMGIAYLFGLFHAYTSSAYNLLQLNFLSIWTGATALIGVLSGVYTIFFYRKREFKNTGRITKIDKLNADVVELEIALDKELDFKDGQFVFVKVHQQGIENNPHPFSISGSNEKKVNLTIKNLGDFTGQVFNDLKTDTKVSLSRAYGIMDFSTGKENQLWIAGGIGITPFISYLKNNKSNKKIEMYYSYHGQEEGIYKEFLENYQKDHKDFKVKFVDTKKEKRLDFNDYKVKENTTIYMCGPPKMMNSLLKTLKNKNEKLDIIHEGFNFK